MHHFLRTLDGSVLSKWWPFCNLQIQSEVNYRDIKSNVTESIIRKISLPPIWWMLILLSVWQCNKKGLCFSLFSKLLSLKCGFFTKRNMITFSCLMTIQNKWFLAPACGKYWFAMQHGQIVLSCAKKKEEEKKRQISPRLVTPSDAASNLGSFANSTKWNLAAF